MREQNAFNSAEAQKNRDWQTEMSNTAHQREVADLQAAGLNPVLSAGGAGASTPGGATASGTQATAENKMLGAMQLYNVMLEQKKMKAETDLIKEQTKYTGYFPETTSGGGSIFGVGGNGSKTTYKKPDAKTNSAMELTNELKNLSNTKAARIAKALLDLKR